MRRFFLLISILLPAALHAQTAADCMGAVSVCSATFNLQYLPQEANQVPNEINPAISCLNGETKGRWYKFAAISPGTLSFTIIPADSTYDFDWALFQTGNCQDIYGDTSLRVSCDFSGTNGTDGSTGADGGPGLGHQPAVNVNSTGTFYLYISSAAVDSTDTLGYTIDFTASTITLEACGEIGVEETELPGDFNIFPNPAHGSVTVDLACSNCTSALLTLLDADGRTVYSCTVSSGVQQIPLDHLQPGIYFYRVLGSDGRASGKKLVIY